MKKLVGIILIVFSQLSIAQAQTTTSSRADVIRACNS